MTAVAAVAAVLTLVVAFGLLGRAPRSRWESVTEICLALLPLMVLSGAAGMSAGFNLAALGVLAVTIILAGLAAILPGTSIDTHLARRAPASTALGWFASMVVLLGLGGMVLAWFANMIASFTTLNSYVVALILTITGIVAGFGGRGRAGQARLGLIVFVVGAVLLALGGFFAGSTTGLTDPSITLASPTIFAFVIFPIAMIVASADNPALRNAAATNRKSYIIAVVVMAACTFVALFGLLMLTGGGFQVPSVQLETFVAYVPGWVGGLLAGVFALVGGASASLTVNLALDASRDLGEQIPVPLNSGVGRSVATALLGAVVFVVAALGPSPIWAIPTIACFAVAGLVAERVARKQRPDRAADDVDTPRLDPAAVGQ
ncbi:MAG: hypothetical protein WCP28_04125 [Actinomycetes bacterium]